MPRQVLESLGWVKEWVFRAPSRVTRIAGGEGIAGARAAPTQSGTNDSTIGGRIDYGETFTNDGKQYRRFKFQVNKGADNPTLKQYANQDSHRVWAQADLEIGGGTESELAERLFADLKSDLEETSP